MQAVKKFLFSSVLVLLFYFYYLLQRNAKERGWYIYFMLLMRLLHTHSLYVIQVQLCTMLKAQIALVTFSCEY